MAFIFDAQKGQTPASVARQRQFADMLMGKTGFRSVDSVPEGIGAGLSALASGFGARMAGNRADAAEAEGRQGATSVYEQLVASLTGQGGNLATQPVEYAPTASVWPSPMDPTARVAQAFGDEQSPFPGAAPKQDRLPQGNMGYRDAIKSIESAGSGDYGAVGPTHPELGRALGAYQVMEANVGPWTREALGQELTPEQFLASPEAQDAVFDKQFGGYVEKFGSPEAAAQAWFGGEGGVGQNDRTDSLGTSIGEYGQKFTQAMGGGQAPQAETAQGGGLSIQQLMQAASNPWLNEGQRAVINMLLEQEMERSDPSNQLDMDYRRAQIDKLQREAEQGGRDGTHGTPFYTMDADGNLHVNFASKSGDKLIRAEAGENEKVLGPYDTSLMRSTGQYEGKDQGEARALYDSMVSKMPGLRTVVDQLDKLTEEATYTWAGRTWDEARKQFGLDPRAEAVARSQYTAIVDNQILPLLRDTFGAQFTVAEGESLRATLGDPNKSPPEKKAVLKAFVGQKERDIEALARRTGQTAPEAPSGGDWQDVGGVKIRRKQ